MFASPSDDFKFQPVVLRVYAHRQHQNAAWNLRAVLFPSGVDFLCGCQPCRVLLPAFAQPNIGERLFSFWYSLCFQIEPHNALPSCPWRNERIEVKRADTLFQCPLVSRNVFSFLRHHGALSVLFLAVGAAPEHFFNFILFFSARLIFFIVNFKVGQAHKRKSPARRAGHTPFLLRSVSIGFVDCASPLDGRRTDLDDFAVVERFCSGCRQIDRITLAADAGRVGVHLVEKKETHGLASQFACALRAGDHQTASRKGFQSDRVARYARFRRAYLAFQHRAALHHRRDALL